MARAIVIALRRLGVSQLKLRVPRYDRTPEAAPTAVIAVAMHCAHMQPEYGNSGRVRPHAPEPFEFGQMRGGGAATMITRRRRTPTTPGSPSAWSLSSDKPVPIERSSPCQSP